MQVGTYPTRNFATLGTFVTTQMHSQPYRFEALERLGHFCLAPHVAMRVGLYLHPQDYQYDLWVNCDLSLGGAPRTVSEDPAMRSFLLIVRTGRIFTAHVVNPKSGVVTWTSTVGYSDVPAYGDYHRCSNRGQPHAL